MKSVCAISVVFSVCCLLYFDCHAVSADTELIVRAESETLDKTEWPAGILKIRHIPRSDIYRLWVTDTRVDAVISLLQNNKRINHVAVAKKGAFPPVAEKSDFMEALTWQDMINLSDIHMLSDGNGVIVALIDSGIDLNNTLFSDMVWVNSAEIPGDGIDNDENGYVDDYQGFDFGDDDAVPQDFNGHGTNMSSAMQEIAPGIRIMVLKICKGGDGSFSEGDLLEAVYYAQSQNAGIINMSLTTPQSTILEEAIQTAYSAGAVVVAAAGNTGESSPVGFPARMPETIAVGAMYTESQVASWISPTGAELDIMAPGVSIPVTGINGVQTYTTGTSVSTAMISAVCAVARSMNPLLTQSQTGDVMIHGVRDLGEPGKDDVYGYGMIDGAVLYGYCLIPIGQQSGIWEYSVTSQTPVRLSVNTLSLYGEEPVLEWFVFTAVIQDMTLPVYLLTGTEIVMLSDSIALSLYTYPYDLADVTVVAELSMSNLGLFEGDIFVYAYAYANEAGEIRFPEIVTVRVLK